LKEMTDQGEERRANAEGRQQSRIRCGDRGHENSSELAAKKTDEKRSQAAGSDSRDNASRKKKWARIYSRDLKGVPKQKRKNASVKRGV